MIWKDSDQSKHFCEAINMATIRDLELTTKILEEVGYEFPTEE